MSHDSIRDTESGLTSEVRALGGDPAERTLDERDPTVLERLLELSLEPSGTEDARWVASRALAALGELFPALAFGITLGRPGAADRVTEICHPHGHVPPAPTDPTRLFPDFPETRELPLHGAASGGILHVAGHDAPSLFEDRRLALALRHLPQMLDVILTRLQVRGGVATESRAQLAQVEKLASLGQLVAGVVHELNNPLTSIVAYADVALKRAERDGQSPEDLERLRRISEAAARIQGFSRDLLAYASPRTQDPSPVSVPDVIDRALWFCDHELRESGASVNREFDANVPPVRGVANKLTQVFVNLFTNAAHAMQGRSGRLVVWVSLGQPGWAIVRVTDDGIGIEPQALAHIFEPFYTTKADGRGTGLGLTIARDLVHEHQGQLHATSEPGTGTTFIIGLPTWEP